MTEYNGNLHHVNPPSVSEVDAAVRLSADEMRTKWLRQHTGSNLSYRTRLVHAAAVSEMSDAAFRILFLQQSYGNGTADNVFPATETIAVLARRGGLAVKRANAELTKLGWLTTKRRRPPLTALRSMTIPQHVMDVITREVSESVGIECDTYNRDQKVSNATPTNSVGIEYDTSVGIKNDTLSITNRTINNSICAHGSSDAEEEAKSATAKKPRVRRQSAEAYTSAFEQAWMAYPRVPNYQKPGAFKSWMKQGCENVAEKVIAGAKSYAEEVIRNGTEPRYIKNMAGWLTEQRWENYASKKSADPAMRNKIKAATQWIDERFWGPIARNAWGSEAGANIPEAILKLAERILAREITLDDAVLEASL